MSALDSSRALNALNLKPLTAAVTAASATSPAKAPEARDQDKTSKATFSRLLAHSRAAVAAQRQPPAEVARSAANPASPSRTSRAADGRTDDTSGKPADAAAPRASTAPSRSAATGRNTSANEAPDRVTDADATAETTEAADTTDDAHPVPTDGAVSDLASLLPASLPPAPPTTPSAADAGTATGDATANPLSPAAAQLAALGKAGAGPAGIEASAKPAVGGKLTDATFASAIDAKSTPDRGSGQASQGVLPGDPKLALDATAASGALPNATLANLAALSVGAGKTDDALKTNAASDVLSPGASAAMASQGLSHLVRSIDGPTSASATVSTAVGDPGFHEALAAQVSVFARGGLSKAELHLNPAELGPVSVQITMNGDQARVDFGADRAQTRQVIEAGWAELATSLKDAGFTLSGGGVSEQAGRQATERQTPPQGGRTERSAAADDAPVTSIVAARPRAGSALDLYA